MAKTLMKIILCFLTVLTILPVVVPRTADASPELRKAAILTTMAEAAVASASLVYERTDGGKLEECSWTADYSER